MPVFLVLRDNPVMKESLSSQVLEGEVVAFDAPTKMLVLKSTASNKRAALNDVHFLNLAMVKDVQVRTF